MRIFERNNNYSEEMYKKINKAFNSNINSLTLGMAYLGVQYYEAIHDQDLSAVKEVKLEILYRIYKYRTFF